MSVESFAKIVLLKSPSDFMAAVMKGSGRASIDRQDVLAALTNHRSRLGQNIMYYWLYEDEKAAAERSAIDAARGGWLMETPFMADREFLARFGRTALSQLMSWQSVNKMIAQINAVSEDAVRKNGKKYDVQKQFFHKLVKVFNHALLMSKEDFLRHFISETD